MASPFEAHGWRTKYFMLEIENSISNGAFGLVVHMGKSMNLDKKHAYNNMFYLLKYACLKLKNPFDILLETTAGQGTELCYLLEDLAEFYSRIKMDKSMSRVKICLDTCHLFSAGYDLRTPKKIDKFIKLFDKLIGVQHVGLVHLNDSVNDLNSHKDRHTSLGEGFIGKIGLKYFYQYFSKKNIPCILETPVENYESEITYLVSK